MAQLCSITINTPGSRGLVNQESAIRYFEVSTYSLLKLTLLKSYSHFHHHNPARFISYTLWKETPSHLLIHPPSTLADDISHFLWQSRPLHHHPPYPQTHSNWILHFCHMIWHPEHLTPPKYTDAAPLPVCRQPMHFTSAEAQLPANTRMFSNKQKANAEPQNCFLEDK